MTNARVDRWLYLRHGCLSSVLKSGRSSRSSSQPPSQPLGQDGASGEKGKKTKKRFLVIDKNDGYKYLFKAEKSGYIRHDISSAHCAIFSENWISFVLLLTLGSEGFNLFTPIFRRFLA